MTAQPSPSVTEKPRCRCRAFRIGALIGFLALAVALYPWYLSGRRQYEAVRSIRALGGGVEYDCQDSRHLTFPRRISLGWVQFYVGQAWAEALLANATAVWLVGHPQEPGSEPEASVLRRPVCDADLAQLAQAIGELPKLSSISIQGDSMVSDAGAASLQKMACLRNLELRQSSIGDEGLRYLQDLHELRWLDLSETRVSDAGLACLGRLTALRQLRLDDTGVTETGLENLQDLTGLEELRLSRTRVRSLQPLRSLKSLRILSLACTPIDDTQLQHLAHLDRLEQIELDETAITDASMPYLRALPDLQTLTLSYTPITDTGLEHLLGLKTLSTLAIHRTNVTPRGIAQLRALPILGRLSLDAMLSSDPDVKSLRRTLPRLLITWRMF